MRWMIFLYPLMELWSLIELGAQTSAGTAVLWVLCAGLAGVAAIRVAGAQVLTRLQVAQREGALQQNLLAGDMALAFAGLLLAVPGLVSDALALLIVIPPLRGLLVKLSGFRGMTSGAQFSQSHAHHARWNAGPPRGGDDGVTLEGEFQELDRKSPMLDGRQTDQNDIN